MHVKAYFEVTERKSEQWERPKRYVNACSYLQPRRDVVTKGPRDEYETRQIRLVPTNPTTTAFIFLHTAVLRWCNRYTLDVSTFSLDTYEFTFTAGVYHY